MTLKENQTSLWSQDGVVVKATQHTVEVLVDNEVVISQFNNDQPITVHSHDLLDVEHAVRALGKWRFIENSRLAEEERARRRVEQARANSARRRRRVSAI